MKIKCSEINVSPLEVLADWLVAEGMVNPEEMQQKDPNWKSHLQKEIGTSLAIQTELIKAGYLVILDEVKHRFPAKEHKRFHISSKSEKNIFSKKAEKMSEAQRMVLYPMLGLTKETVKDIYAIGRDLIHQERWAHATQAFNFLNWLHPFVPWFWLELGKSWEKQNELGLALYAYGVAINLSPTTPELYRYAVNGCIQLGDHQRAKEIIHYGIDSCRVAEWSHDSLQHLNELEAMLHAVEKLETKKARGK